MPDTINDIYAQYGMPGAAPISPDKSSAPENPIAGPDPGSYTPTAPPNLDAITNLVNQVNQRAWLSAPGRSEALTNIQAGLAGQFDPGWLEQTRTNLATQYGGAGFGVDTQALNAAMMRASGLERRDIMSDAAQQLNALYQGMPVTGAETYTVKPETWAQYETNRAQRALEAERYRDEAARWRSELAARQAQERASLAGKLPRSGLAGFGAYSQYLQDAFGGVGGTPWASAADTYEREAERARLGEIRGMMQALGTGGSPNIPAMPSFGLGTSTTGGLNWWS